jgi:hypothetical protein
MSTHNKIKYNNSGERVIEGKKKKKCVQLLDEKNELFLSGL